MLNDIEYIRQGIESVLIYTRALTSMSMNMQLSFLEKNKDYILRARHYRYSYRELFRRAVRIANRNIIEEVVKGGIIATEYTMPMEELTEELFGIDTDKETTILVLNLESGIPVPSKDLLYEVTYILRQMRQLNIEFVSFLTDVLEKLNNVTIFMFNFEMNMRSSFKKIAIFNKSIDRLLSREKFSPNYVAGLQLAFNEVMVLDAYLIGSFINQSEETIIKTGRIISKDFENLMPEYYLQLSPLLQSQLSEKSYELILNFISYLKYVLGRIEKRNIQFIASPIYFDNLLREANFYKFILEGNIKQLDGEMNGIIRP